MERVCIAKYNKSGFKVVSLSIATGTIQERVGSRGWDLSNVSAEWDPALPNLKCSLHKVALLLYLFSARLEKVERKMDTATTLGSCLTCFSEVPPSALPKCVIHSCCSRPVCTTCLITMPRLATFCPFCEGVQHALRKGPRHDVTRAGQIVFDFDNTAYDDREALPAYEDHRDDIQEKQNFVVEQDDEEDETQELHRSTPQLLHTSRLGIKQNAAHAHIDRSKLATVKVTTKGNSLPTVDSLRQSLSKKSTCGVDFGTIASRKAINQSQVTADELGHASGSSSIHSSKHDDVSGLTRQYWLRPNDTLMSLCLRFRVNAATVCKLNDLPLSTANTTPHLVHTRQFLLIPEGAIQSALSCSSDSEGLQSALDGPAAQSKRQKIQRARREAQSRFRAIIAKNESLVKGKGRGDNGDVTLCDDRAAKAYISLLEAELRCVDFGDGTQEMDEDEKGKKEEGGKEEVEDLDATVEAGRRERFNVIVKQAVCRWEMDSDWEREQRAMGIMPLEGVTAPSLSTKNTFTPSSNWYQKLTSSHNQDKSRVGWLEKVR